MKRSPLKIAGVLASLAVLGIVVFNLARGGGIQALTQSWARLSSRDLALAITALLAMQVCAAWRTRIIMRADGLERPSVLALFRLQLVSQFLAHGSPVSGLADAARVAMLALRFHMPFGRSLRLVAYDRVTGALGVMAIGVAALATQVFITVPAEVVLLQAAVWGTGVLVLCLLLYAPRITARTGIRMLDKVVDAAAILAQLLRRPWVTLGLLASAAMQLACVAAAFVILAHAMQIGIAEKFIVLLTPSVFFISSLPVFYVGWGAREAAVILTMGIAASVGSAESASLSIAYGAAVFISSLPGAVFWAMRPSMRKSIREELDHENRGDR